VGGEGLHEAMVGGLTVTTQAERITAVEVRLGNLETKVDKIDGKLDDLLALRHKGVGAFWLASTILGTGIVGGAVTLFNYLLGK
jgi:hypothetical protein